ncbi:Tetrapyrrole-binding protein, chloroplastic [Glycine soja]|uniref:Tetrapyrrole-binding protein, chloroplastic n=1 Tax=Glycine soja TaxID=3848 RepID=A0A0B2PF53_GLYSO|nr:Tetrapyrrole-binding protein, chloroplastic [Glycine soja]
MFQTKMATNSLHYSIQHHQCSLTKRHHPSDTPPHTSLFLKHPTPPIHPNITISHTPSNSHITYSLSQTTSSSTTSPTTPSFDLLRHHLSTNNFQLADEETRRLLIVLAGEAAQKRGYKKLLEKANGDFTKFFIKVGWMKKLDTEMEQYNYRSFPTEFIWELNDDTPEGHLPLTNALRGTQLLNNVLKHPAFDVVDDKEEKEKDGENKENGGAISATGLKDNGSSSKRIFKTDYSF